MHTALEKLHHHFIPSRHNAYRPHILRKPWLLFFLTLTFAAEGFLVANLVVRQSSQVFLAAVATSPNNHFLFDGVERVAARFLVNPQLGTTWALGLIASVLLVAIFLTFFIHIQVQPTDMLARGALIALFALSLIVINAHFTKIIAQDSSQPQTASARFAPLPQP